MLKKSNYIRSRRLNTIIEIAETQDENENSLAVSIPGKEQISSGACTAARTLSKIPLAERSVARSPRVEQVVSSHATPETQLSTTSHWREKPKVSTKPTGMDKNSNTDALTLNLRRSEKIFPKLSFFFLNSLQTVRRNAFPKRLRMLTRKLINTLRARATIRSSSPGWICLGRKFMVRARPARVLRKYEREFLYSRSWASWNNVNRSDWWIYAHLSTYNHKNRSHPNNFRGK